MGNGDSELDELLAEFFALRDLWPLMPELQWWRQFAQHVLPSQLPSPLSPLTGHQFIVLHRQAGAGGKVLWQRALELLDEE